jgi:hypothetical protein
MLTICSHKGNANQNLRFYLTAIRITAIKTPKSACVGNDVEKKERFYTASVKAS